MSLLKSVLTFKKRTRSNSPGSELFMKAAVHRAGTVFGQGACFLPLFRWGFHLPLQTAQVHHPVSLSISSFTFIPPPIEKMLLIRKTENLFSPHRNLTRLKPYVAVL
jgi:hypothetical protein